MECARREPILSVERLSKKHAHQLRKTSWYGLRDIGREFLLRDSCSAARAGEFWALQDVGFEVRSGESVAIIGANGAGKTTLLKLLYGLAKPDRGEVRIRGDVQAIIELGSGMNPLLSGRENIRLAGALHGFSGATRAAYEEEVMRFADVGEFIGDPVQAYSSGMRARLAYSIAAHLRPDLLLIDEVLAVGDSEFQRKCLHHMRRFVNEGGALVLVSHNIHQVQAICTRAIVIDGGRTVFEGPTVDAVSHYFETRAQAAPSRSRTGAAQSATTRIEQVVAEPLQGDTVRTGEPLRVRIHYHATERVTAVIGFSVMSADGTIMITGNHDFPGRDIRLGPGEALCLIRQLPLVPGRYLLRAFLVEQQTHLPLALFGYEDAGCPVTVRGEVDLLTNAQIQQGQLVRVEGSWK